MKNYRGLSLRDLGYIVAVADELNFHKAAERCCATQSTLSTQIGKFERYLGVEIFTRDQQGVDVTALGAQVVSRARLVLQLADSILHLRSQPKRVVSLATSVDSDHQSRTTGARA
jgi:LysR family hydrogen peroxide-inducible transcriptional activator